MTIKDQIITHLDEIIDASEFFVVNVAVSPSKVRQKITILLDKDSGISLDECAEISRKLGDRLEEQETIDNAYTLEVSSPGTDFPLSSVRQFNKNIGRTLKIIKKDGIELKGKLSTVTDQNISIEIEPNKKKKETQPTIHEIAYDDIAKAQVQVVW